MLRLPPDSGLGSVVQVGGSSVVWLSQVGCSGCSGSFRGQHEDPTVAGFDWLLASIVVGWAAKESSLCLVGALRSCCIGLGHSGWLGPSDREWPNRWQPDPSSGSVGSDSVGLGGALGPGESVWQPVQWSSRDLTADLRT